jgi:hypothetical protein
MSAARIARRLGAPAAHCAPWLAAMSLWLTASCAHAPLPTGDALHGALQGLWCNSNDGGRSCWAWDEFGADGRFEACGRTDDDPQPFRGAGTVSVSGRRMCYVVSAASDNFWLRPGQRYCTDIVAVDRHTHRYRDIDTGAEFTLYRRAAAEKRCP